LKTHDWREKRMKRMTKAYRSFGTVLKGKYSCNWGPRRI
jgi:hypothetical protein